MLQDQTTVQRMTVTLNEKEISATQQLQAIEQALLQLTATQKIPVSLLLVILSIAALHLQSVDWLLLAGWTVIASVTVGLRLFWLPGLVSNTSIDPGRRLKKWRYMAMHNAFAFALAIGFFPMADATIRSLHTMIIVGMLVGTIAGSAGYRPIFLSSTAPIMVALIVGWLALPVPGNWWIGYTVAVLLVLLYTVLDSLAKTTYNSFTNNIITTQKLQQSNAALEQSLKSEQAASAAKTRFIASASHDLRQPLHTLSLLSAALTLRPLDEKSASIASSMNEAMADLAGELDTLLDISRLDAGVMKNEPEVIDATLAIRRVVAGYRKMADSKNLRISTTFATNPNICVDKMMFDRVLRNLIDNALKYTSHGTVNVSVTEQSGRCLIAISDTGIGIAAEQQALVFEEFYQVENPERDRSKGLGLGLSIVSRLTKLIGGNIQLESTPGKGTTVTVSLPTVTTPASAGNDTDPPGAPQQLAGICVLIVDDDSGVRAGTRTLLEELSCEVLEAASSQSAAECLRHSTPQVALVDLRLPDGDSGFKVAELLERESPTTEVVLISGEITPATLQEAARRQLQILVKPVPEHELLAAIASSYQRPPAAPANL